jgi:hypothetical protein
MGFMDSNADEDTQTAEVYVHAVTCNILFVGERKLVHEHVIHVKDNADVRQCCTWSTNIVQEQAASIFRADQSLLP